MIDLDNLVTLHDRDKTIRRHKRILEELFYLCINETFIKSVTEARTTIQTMMPNIGIDLPIQNKDTATEIRNKYLVRNDDYQALLVIISERHSYFHPSFIRNYSRVAADAYAYNKFNVLENILFLNDPLPDVNMDPTEHFNNRSGYMELSVDENGPYIRMQFDIGTTKKEMEDIIDKLFPETAQLQEERYNIPDAQYRTDSNLRAKDFILKHTLLGDTDPSIAVQLEATGLLKEQDNHDYVRMHRQRITRATKRFDAND